MGKGIIYGITGSRELTNPPLIERAIKQFEPESLVVTGGCIGVDAHAARVASDLGHHVLTILPKDKRLVDPEWRDHCHWFEDNGLEFLERDQRIVDICWHLFGFPKGPEIIRSGTWATIRMARKKRRLHTVYIQSSPSLLLQPT